MDPVNASVKPTTYLAVDGLDREDAEDLVVVGNGLRYAEVLVLEVRLREIVQSSNSREIVDDVVVAPVIRRSDDRLAGGDAVTDETNVGREADRVVGGGAGG